MAVNGERYRDHFRTSPDQGGTLAISLGGGDGGNDGRLKPRFPSAAEAQRASNSIRRVVVESPRADGASAKTAEPSSGPTADDGGGGTASGGAINGTVDGEHRRTCEATTTSRRDGAGLATRTAVSSSTPAAAATVEHPGGLDATVAVAADKEEEEEEPLPGGVMELLASARSGKAAAASRSPHPPPGSPSGFRRPRHFRSASVGGAITPRTAKALGDIGGDFSLPPLSPQPPRRKAALVSTSVDGGVLLWSPPGATPGAPSASVPPSSAPPASPPAAERSATSMGSGAAMQGGAAESESDEDESGGEECVVTRVLERGDARGRMLKMKNALMQQQQQQQQDASEQAQRGQEASVSSNTILPGAHQQLAGFVAQKQLAAPVAVASSSGRQRLEASSSQQRKRDDQRNASGAGALGAAAWDVGQVGKCSKSDDSTRRQDGRRQASAGDRRVGADSRAGVASASADTTRPGVRLPPGLEPDASARHTPTPYSRLCSAPSLAPLSPSRAAPPLAEQGGALRRAGLRIPRNASVPDSLSAMGADPVHPLSPQPRARMIPRNASVPGDLDAMDAVSPPSADLPPQSPQLPPRKSSRSVSFEIGVVRAPRHSGLLPVGWPRSAPATLALSVSPAAAADPAAAGAGRSDRSAGSSAGSQSAGTEGAGSEGESSSRESGGEECVVARVLERGDARGRMLKMKNALMQQQQQHKWHEAAGQSPRRQQQAPASDSIPTPHLPSASVVESPAHLSSALRRGAQVIPRIASAPDSFSSTSCASLAPALDGGMIAGGGGRGAVGASTAPQNGLPLTAPLQRKPSASPSAEAPAVLHPTHRASLSPPPASPHRSSPHHPHFLVPRSSSTGAPLAPLPRTTLSAQASPRASPRAASFTSSFVQPHGSAWHRPPKQAAAAAASAHASHPRALSLDVSGVWAPVEGVGASAGAGADGSAGHSPASRARGLYSSEASPRKPPNISATRLVEAGVGRRGVMEAHGHGETAAGGQIRASRAGVALVSPRGSASGTHTADGNRWSSGGNPAALGGNQAALGANQALAGNQIRNHGHTRSRSVGTVGYEATGDGARFPPPADVSALKQALIGSPRGLASGARRGGTGWASRGGGMPRAGGVAAGRAGMGRGAQSGGRSFDSLIPSMKAPSPDLTTDAAPSASTALAAAASPVTAFAPQDMPAPAAASTAAPSSAAASTSNPALVPSPASATTAAPKAPSSTAASPSLYAPLSAATHLRPPTPSSHTLSAYTGITLSRISRSHTTSDAPVAAAGAAGAGNNPSGHRRTWSDSLALPSANPRTPLPHSTSAASSASAAVANSAAAAGAGVGGPAAAAGARVSAGCVDGPMSTLAISSSRGGALMVSGRTRSKWVPGTGAPHITTATIAQACKGGQVVFEYQQRRPPPSNESYPSAATIGTTAPVASAAIIRSPVPGVAGVPAGAGGVAAAGAAVGGNNISRHRRARSDSLAIPIANIMRTPLPDSTSSAAAAAAAAAAGGARVGEPAVASARITQGCKGDHLVSENQQGGTPHSYDSFSRTATIRADTGCDRRSAGAAGGAAAVNRSPFPGFNGAHSMSSSSVPQCTAPEPHMPPLVKAGRSVSGSGSSSSRTSSSSHSTSGGGSSIARNTDTGRGNAGRRGIGGGEGVGGGGGGGWRDPGSSIDSSSGGRGSANDSSSSACTPTTMASSMASTSTSEHHSSRNTTSQPPASSHPAAQETLLGTVVNHVMAHLQYPRSYSEPLASSSEVRHTMVHRKSRFHMHRMRREQVKDLNLAGSSEEEDEREDGDETSEASGSGNEESGESGERKEREGREQRPRVKAAGQQRSREAVAARYPLAALASHIPRSHSDSTQQGTSLVLQNSPCIGRDPSQGMYVPGSSSKSHRGSGSAWRGREKSNCMGGWSPNGSPTASPCDSPWSCSPASPPQMSPGASPGRSAGSPMCLDPPVHIKRSPLSPLSAPGAAGTAGEPGVGGHRGTVGGEARVLRKDRGMGVRRRRRAESWGGVEDDDYWGKEMWQPLVGSSPAGPTSPLGAQGRTEAEEWEIGGRGATLGGSTRGQKHSEVPVLGRAPAPATAQDKHTLSNCAGSGCG
ncbi:hypothetical protein CLOM_g14566 [Closterium sp. NIES-68]|nr:hypothetical protein CLOM_g14566 [Closterium sp. NIES-68]GJP58567.1 hypothetical protein CLOP_g445 [Closterium sp. NIES-67]